MSQLNVTLSSKCILLFVISLAILAVTVSVDLSIIYSGGTEYHQRISKRNGIGPATNCSNLNYCFENEDQSIILHTYLSAVRCIDSCCEPQQRNRSCLWENLYYADGKFFALALEGHRSNDIEPASTKVMISMRSPWDPSTSSFPWESPMIIDKLVMKNLSELQDFVVDLTFKEGLTMLFTRSPDNFGHAMLDGLYPAFVSAVKLGELNFSNYDRDFRALAIGEFPNPTRYKPEEIIRQFSGKTDYLSQYKAGFVYQFEKAIIGSGQMGARTPTMSYEIPGRDIHALRMFRNRFYFRYNIPLPSRKSSMDNRSPNSPLKALMIQNKRDLGNLHEHMRLLTEKSQGKVVGNVVSLAELSFKNQLKLFAETDLYISGVGTALTACFLVPDGSVIINVGDVENGVVRFWEEYIAAGMDWVQALYMDPVSRRRGIFSEDLFKLIMTGVQQIQRDFLIPVPPLVNNSPLSKAVVNLFKVDWRLWASMLGDIPPERTNDFVSCLEWAEHLVCETGPYSRDDCIHLNRSLIAEVRNRHQVSIYCGPDQDLAG